MKNEGFGKNRDIKERGLNKSGRLNDSHTSHLSHRSSPLDSSHPIIPPRGDPRTLKSFIKAEVVYDITFRFVHKYLQRGDRTVDQMIQSARSGKKNILEGSKAGRTSKEMELKLTNVARASLEEVLDDYLDFLRARDLRIWAPESKEARYVRDLGRRDPQGYELYREFVETRPPETVANLAICLIHQANYLIDRQLGRLEKEFVEQGGLREKMTQARLDYRDRRNRKNGKYGKNEKKDTLRETGRDYTA